MCCVVESGEKATSKTQRKKNRNFFILLLSIVFSFKLNKWTTMTKELMGFARDDGGQNKQEVEMQREICEKFRDLWWRNTD